MSATPRTDALEKAVSLGMVGSQLFAEVRKMEKELEAMTEGLKIASVAVENLRHEVNAHRNAAMEADLRTRRFSTPPRNLLSLLAWCWCR